ncbi:MAG: hypothetical protein ACQSGP_21300 [Frankia sp.]
MSVGTRAPAFMALPVGVSVMFFVAVVSGTGHVVVALALLSVVAFAVGSVSVLPVALAASAIGWSFLSGCVEPGQVLTFHGVADFIRLLVITGAGLAGWLVVTVRREVTSRTQRLVTVPYPEPFPQVPVPR